MLYFAFSLYGYLINDDNTYNRLSEKQYKYLNISCGDAGICVIKHIRNSEKSIFNDKDTINVIDLIIKDCNDLKNDPIMKQDINEATVVL